MERCSNILASQACHPFAFYNFDRPKKSVVQPIAFDPKILYNTNIEIMVFENLPVLARADSFNLPFGNPGLSLEIPWTEELPQGGDEKEGNDQGIDPCYIPQRFFRKDAQPFLILVIGLRAK